MRRLFATLALLLISSGASPAELRVSVRDAGGATVSDAVVWAVQKGAKVSPPKTEAVMDQRNRTFVPHVLAVQTGTAVRFPNSDNVRHQVYSFSAPKRFQLPLYEGSPSEPIVFDKPGVVSLGCNIHDRMSAYIVIVDTPWFGVAENGVAELAGLPPGSYSVHAWWEKLRGDPPAQSLELATGDSREVVFTVGGK